VLITNRKARWIFEFPLWPFAAAASAVWLICRSHAAESVPAVLIVSTVALAFWLLTAAFIRVRDDALRCWTLRGLRTRKSNSVRIESHAIVGAKGPVLHIRIVASGDTVIDFRRAYTDALLFVARISRTLGIPVHRDTLTCYPEIGQTLEQLERPWYEFFSWADYTVAALIVAALGMVLMKC
jgi:hypothetical protein